jgi:hypothetical protein
LIRKVTEDVREEVIVSSRRALGSEPVALESLPVTTPVQGTLFDKGLLPPP